MKWEGIMEVNENGVLIIQEFENQYIDKDKSQDDKITFFDVLRMQQKKTKQKLNIYEIAARIARGEFVSSEELKYIKENAPVLYIKALMMYEENKQRKMDNKGRNQDKKMMCIIEHKKKNKNGHDKKENATDSIFRKIEAHNSSLSLDKDHRIESILEAL